MPSAIWTGSISFGLVTVPVRMLGAFPLFALAGMLLAERPKLRVPVLTAAAALLVIGAFGYARNWYLT